MHPFHLFAMRYFSLLVGLLLVSACVASPTDTPPQPGSSSSSSASSVEQAHADVIRIESPLPGETVGTTFEVTGEARGPWYFEASFPVSVEDTSGRVIVQTHAQALGEWMTEAFVPFKATVKVLGQEGKDAVLVIKNDNPSGLPEHEKEVRIPIHIGN